MSEIWMTADTHFFHWNIVRHCNRPFATIEEHDQKLIDNWNNVVGKKDTVYILGDFAWKRHGHYIGALNGRRILLVGNHDKMPQECLRNFTEVHTLLRRNICGRDVTMCHYCMTTWASSCHGSWHFFGHSHGRIKEFDDSFKMDVGVDVWNYTPIPWGLIEYKMSLKKKSENNRSPDELDECVKKNKDTNAVIFAQWNSEKNIALPTIPLDNTDDL